MSVIKIKYLVARAVCDGVYMTCHFAVEEGDLTDALLVVTAHVEHKV